VATLSEKLDQLSGTLRAVPEQEARPGAKTRPRSASGMNRLRRFWEGGK